MFYIIHNEKLFGKREVGSWGEREVRKP